MVWVSTTGHSKRDMAGDGGDRLSGWVFSNMCGSQAESNDVLPVWLLQKRASADRATCGRSPSFSRCLLIVDGER